MERPPAQPNMRGSTALLNWPSRIHDSILVVMLISDRNSLLQRLRYVVAAPRVNVDLRDGRLYSNSVPLSR